jgi:hypothetical protein
VSGVGPQRVKERENPSLTIASTVPIMRSVSRRIERILTVLNSYIILSCGSEIDIDNFV